MTKLQAVTSGDVGVVKVVQLGGVDNLDDAASVEAHVWRDRDAVTTLSATVSDSANRYVSVDLGTAVDDWLPALSILAGVVVQFKFDVEVTWTDGGVTTWSGHVLPVRGQGA